MNQQSIEAFHAYNTLSDIIDECKMSNKQFESMIIQLIRTHYPLKPTNSNILVDSPTDFVSNETSIKISDSLDYSNIELSEEQKEFIRLALEGESIFLTAPGGYGKSHCLAELVSQLRNRYDTCKDIPTRVAVCASTGKAASLIDGRTVHSYLGIGLAKQPAEELYEKLITTRRLKPKYKELLNLKVLVIDEVSMINNVLLDKISKYLSLVKDNSNPFGGIQIIFVGDLHQLAPIEGRYFIRAKSYIELHPIVIQLTKCFRQDDPVFQKILSEARVGKLTRESYEVLMKQNDIDLESFPGMKPTLICSTNQEVEAINQRELNKLSKDLTTYTIKPISPNTKKIEIAARLDAIPERIDLAVDAQIMITTNISMSGRVIANGTQGKVISMYDTHINARLVGWGSDVKIGFQKVLDPDCIDPDSNPVYLFEYLPVRLGWSSTIHRAQGCTVDLLEVDLGRIFAAGQAYVAISRVRSLAGLKITGLKRKAFISDAEIIEFYAKQ